MLEFPYKTEPVFVLFFSTLITITVSYICYRFLGSVLVIYMLIENHSLYPASSSVPGAISLVLFPILCMVFFPRFFSWFRLVNDISNTYTSTEMDFSQRKRFFSQTEYFFYLLILETRMMLRAAEKWWEHVLSEGGSSYCALSCCCLAGMWGQSGQIFQFLQKSSCVCVCLRSLTF